MVKNGMNNNQLTLFGEEKKHYSYEEAITKFIEEYMEMPKDWYKPTENYKKVLFPGYVHIAISLMIFNGLFDSPEEVKEEFFNEYGMVLYYNAELGCLE